MAGAVISIADAAAADTILSVKQRVFALNRKLYVGRQRLVYTAGPRGMDALADDETLGGAGVAQDGSAQLDVLLVDLTPAESITLNQKVYGIRKDLTAWLFEFWQCALLFLSLTLSTTPCALIARWSCQCDDNSCFRLPGTVARTTCAN